MHQSKAMESKSKSVRNPLAGSSGMREEIRAVLLKMVFLALTTKHGNEISTSLFKEADVDLDAVEQEIGWFSADATKRVLTLIAAKFGIDTIADFAPFISHPETLGPWVRLVREAKTPLEAYRYLVNNGAEQTRMGEFEWIESDTPVKKGIQQIQIAYKIKADELPETDYLLCRLRQALLRGLVTFWGLPPAQIKEHECVVDGRESCRYELTWHEGSSHGRLAGLYGLFGALIVGIPVGFLGNIWAGLLSAAPTGALGFGVGQLLMRMQLSERERAFERTRIAALERGLLFRGESNVTSTPGDLVGNVLAGKYRIGKRIGSGGIGVVHAAEHLGLGTQVAIKVLRGAAAKDGAEIARLRREAQVASALDHPNVVKVIDLDTLADGSLFVVMELLRGKSLAERLHKEGPLGPGQAVQVFRQVCSALAAAHDLGVIHRDLKPGNVFLCEDGKTAKVLDFGMSKLAQTGNEKLTQDGYTLGTPEYMAPEQCIGAPVEPRTDLYELGVLIYEALTGDLPIKSANRRDLLELHQRQIPPLMRERRPDLPIPIELDQAVAMCLRKRVHERPETARHFEQMLAGVPLDGVPFAYARNVGKSPAPSHRRISEAEAEPRSTVPNRKL